MRPTLRPAHLLTIVCLVALLSGCSTGGIVGPESVGSRHAPSQVATVLFVQQWSQILWGLVTSQTGTQAPEFGDPVFNHDGSISQTYTGADGTVAVITALLDGTVRLEMTYPDARTQTVVQGVSQFDGVSKTTIDWQVTSSDGTTVTYSSVVDDQGTIFDISDDTTELSGSSALPTGVTQDFDVMTAGGQTDVSSQQSDGSTFSLEVPLRGPDFMGPDWRREATGSYAIDGTTVNFTLSSTAQAPGRWARMTTQLGGGVTGDYFLDTDFSGSGRLLQDAGLVALPSWTQMGDTEVNSVTADSSHAAPAGAALDYLMHRWQTLAALLAPAPGVASAGTPIVLTRELQRAG